MSGGYFDGTHYRIAGAAAIIQDVLVINDGEYSEETNEEFKKALKILRQAEVYVQRIDWLLSGDDGEESFHRRLKMQLDDLEIDE